MNLSHWLPRSHRLLVLAVILFVVTWPLERRKLFFTEYSFVTGAYTEAGTLALYVSDLAFVLLALAWAWWRFRSRREQIGVHPRQGVPRRSLLLGFAFLAWVLFSTVTTPENPLSWYAFARIAQGFLLFLVTYDLWLIPALRNTAFRMMVLVGVLESLLGIGQVLRSADLGLHFVGEPPLSVLTPGVAKVDIMDHSSRLVNVPSGTDTRIPEHGSYKKVLRAYGTFPHPNILGSFLLVSMVILSFSMYQKPSTISSSGDKLFLSEQFIRHVSYLIITAGIILTFSRQAWIGILVLLLVMLICSRRNIDLRRLYMLFIGPVLLIITISAFRPDIGRAFLSRIVPPETDYFVWGRVSSYRNVQHALREHPLVGSSSGNSFIGVVGNIRLEGNVRDGDNEHIVPIGTSVGPWIYQYPHSVPIMLVLEYGAIGAIIIVLLVVSLFRGYHHVNSTIVPSGTILLPILVSCVFLPSVLFDHFPWTIQQGRILLWGGLGAVGAHVNGLRSKTYLT